MSFEVIFVRFLQYKLTELISLSLSLSSNDDKRVVTDDQIHTLVYGHVQLVLPNKPMSNIEIINAAKRPCISVFKGVLFLRYPLMRE